MANSPREQLGEMLRQARLDAGYPTHGAFARELHVSRSLVAKAESPNQPVPSVGLLELWAGSTDADLEALKDLARRARSGTPDWFMPFRSAEAEATTLRFWGPLVVPGLLQTEGYARAHEHRDEVVTARLERQQVLGHVHLVAAIDYTVLQRCIGSPQIMADQCTHVIRLIEDEMIRLHVVPDGANAGLGGAFGIATKAGSSTVSFTTAIQDVTSTAASAVDGTVNLFEQILGYAMTPDASLDFLRTQEEMWKQQI